MSNTVRTDARLSTDYSGNGDFRVIYPPQPTFCENCNVNLEYDTIPPDTKYREVTLGPTSIKHLYRGAWYYPLQKQMVPCDTMYGRTSDVVWPHHYRRTYGKMIYPFRHRSPREVREFSSTILPVPAIEQVTTYRTVSDGAWGR